MPGHELRNPLGAISTALFLLQEDPANPATQKGALEVATRQARHMKQMLDDLLDLARINEGRITLQRARVDLGTEIQQALEVAQPVFALRKHAVSMSLPAERIYVMADPVRLGQCFSNLFTNAARYTNLGGRIDVSLARDDGNACAPNQSPTIVRLPRNSPWTRATRARFGGIDTRNSRRISNCSR